MNIHIHNTNYDKNRKKHVSKMRLLRQKHHNNNYKQRNNTKNPLYIFLTKLTSFAQIMDPESGG